MLTLAWCHKKSFRHPEKALIWKKKKTLHPKIHSTIYNNQRHGDTSVPMTDEWAKTQGVLLGHKGWCLPSAAAWVAPG